MQCDRCGEREAVINFTQVEQDTKVTLHLCEQCAAEQGVETGADKLKSPLGDFLASLGTSGDGVACSACGGTLQDFRDSGRLGCADCYTSFEGHLRDLLRRVHGASQHTGEAYLPVDRPVESDDRLADLRDQLQRAVASENFELAAELRDRIKVLE
jgi:protein arginine kinase activator